MLFLANILPVCWNELKVAIKHFKLAITGKTPCKYGPVFAPYLHDWTLYGINTVQKWVRIYMAFFLCMIIK